MKSFTLFISLSLALLTSSALLADENQGHREVLLENDKVEVVRLTYPPGTESGVHSHKHPHRVVYVISGGTIELVPLDSNKPSQVITAKTGMTMFVPGNTHNVKNVGDSQIILLETEIKKL